MSDKITFENVVMWLAEKGLPINDAIRICRKNLKDGLVLLNKLKEDDKKHEKTI